MFQIFNSVPAKVPATLAAATLRTFTFCILHFTFFGFLSGQTTLSGRILDATGAPLPGANVVLEERVQGDVADAQGQYRITDVPPGTWTLRASFVGYETQRQKVTIAPNTGTLTLDFRLAEQGLNMEPLIVRATRATERTPMSYVLLDKSAIERNNVGLDAPYLFRWTPSAVETSDAGAGVGYTGIRIRGSDATRINVTINGIPLNDAESQIVYWVNMPDFLSSVDNVQIQRGVGASTNGAGAFGATINLQTNSLPAEAYAGVNLGAGSFNTLRRNVQFGSGRLGNGFSIEGRLSHISSDGYIDRASSDLRSWYLSAGWMGDRSLLKFNVFSGQERTYQAWYGVPAEFLNDPKLRRFNPAGTERPGEPYDNEIDNYRQTHYQLIRNTQLSSNWNLNLALHYTRGAGYFEQYKAEQAFAGYGLPDLVAGGETISQTNLIRRLWLDNHFYGGVYSLTYRSADTRIEAVLGGAYSIYEGLHFGEVVWAEFAGSLPKGFRYYENDARKTDFNIYQKLNYRLSDKWDSYLDLQYRRVGYDFLGYNIELEQVDQTLRLGFFNPKFGMQYRPGPRAEAYASFAVASREPNRNDYTQSTPDARPLPEQLYNTEIGYRYAGKKGAVAANVYHMYYRDQLVVNGEINQVGEYVRINVPRSFRLGLELMTEYRPAEKLKLTANYTISRNRVSAFTEFVDEYDEDFNWTGQLAIERRNTALAFSPAHIANGELEWHLIGKPEDKKSLSAALLSKYVGKQYIDNASDEANALSPYFFSDLRVQYVIQPTFARRIGLTLLVQNLFNEQFASNAWSYRYTFDGAPLLDQGFFPQAGTNFLLGLNVGF